MGTKRRVALTGLGCIFILIVVGVSLVMLAGMLLNRAAEAWMSTPTHREYVVAGNCRFSGPLAGTSAIYRNIRIGDRMNALGQELDLQLVLQDRTTSIRTLTIEEAVALGFEITGPAYVRDPERTRHGFRGWGEQNRQGRINLVFIDGTLTEFHAGWSSPRDCPFSFTIPAGDAIMLPCSEEALRQAVGPSESVRDYFAK